MRWVVVGMHRSGTSLLMKFFERAGFYLGETVDFHPPATHDPEGYRERIDAWALNEEMLAASGSAWDRPQRFAMERISDSARLDFAGAARVIVEGLDERAQAAQAPGWAMKDPRLSLTLELWRPALDTLPHSGADPTRYVLLTRDPLAVARSFASRDGLPIDVGLALWETYHRAAARNLGLLGASVLQHAELLHEPHLAWHRLFAIAGLPTPPLETAEELVTPSLDRHSAAAAEADPWLWPEIRRLREQMEAGALRDVDSELSAPARTKLDNWADRAG